VAVNPVTGDLYVAYVDQANGSADKADICFTESTDGGKKWTKPVRVNNDATNNDQWQPALAVTPDGSHLGIFWYDRRLDSANNLIDRFGVIGAVLGHGVSFAPNFRITDVSFPPAFGQEPFGPPDYMGDYDQAAADNSFFYTTWGDNRLGNSFYANQPDVRFAKITVTGMAALPADTAAAYPGRQSLTSDEVQPLFDAALNRWRRAGMDAVALHGLDLRSADLGGATLGLAAGHTIWLDDNAVGWGWFVDKTPWEDSEFTTPGNQGEQGRMDLLTVPEHEIGHLLGRDHEADGVMDQALTAGTRRDPSSSSDPTNVAALDRVFTDGGSSLAAPFAAESFLQALLNGERQQEGKAKT
jgi:hypothetical protein